MHYHMLQMADDAATIVGRWRQHVPPRVPKEEVQKVVEAYFPGAHTIKEKTSHWLIVQHELLRLASQHGFSAHFTGGRLSIPHTGGREVKQVYVKMLLEAIDIKELYDRVIEESSGGRSE